MNVKAGQVIAKESFPKWYELHLKLLYWRIRSVQKRRWGKNYRATHVYIVLVNPHNGLLSLFEQTLPVAKWTPLSYLKDKTYAVCEYVDHDNLNQGAMVSQAVMFEGRKYDVGDLVDIQIGAWFTGGKVYRFLGDKAKRLGVCSTVVGRILTTGGAMITWLKRITPAYYEGNGPGWCVVKRYNRGKRL